MAVEAQLISGRYRLESLLGRGGMGQVWRGFDEILGRPVAVKEIRFPPDLAESDRDALRARMLREARLTARLNHPGIATTYDVVSEGGRPFIVMELVEARNLSDEIEQDGPLSTGRTARIGLALLEALQSAHLSGIVHRDVKPSNVLLADDGRVVLTDFGIATSETDPSLTSTGLVIGSPAYMSPERLRGEPIGAAADLWSLGATLYSAVEGEPPFRAQTTVGTITAVLADDVSPTHEPGPMREALLGLLDKDPQRRMGPDHVRALLHQAAAAPGPDRPRSDGWSRTTVSDPLAEPRSTQADGFAPREVDSAEPMSVVPVGPGLWTGGHEPEPAAPAPPAALWSFSDAPPASSSVRRPGMRSLRAGLVLLALVAVLVVGVIVLQRPDRTAGSPSQANTNDGGTSGAEQGATSGSTRPSTTSAPTSKASTATSPPASPGTSQSTAPGNGGSSRAAPAPPGYQLQRDPLGFRVAVPQGWQRRLDGPTRVDFVSPDGSTFLRVDQRAQALPDAARAWFDAEPSVAASLPGYSRIRIDPIVYRGWDGADWEFTWQAQGGTIHVLDRGLIVPPKGWALYVSAPDAVWSSRGRRLLDVASRTFRPAA